MTPTSFAALFALALLVLVAAFVAVVTYNAVVALGNRIDKAWANIDVALKQRYDELPRLVEAVRGVMAYERGVLDEVTRTRSAYVATDPIPRQAATSDATTAAVKSLFGVVEKYPELKAAGNVTSLQAEVARLENVIADRRELYNDQVYRYNTRIAQLPGRLFAGLFGWRKRDFFAADPDERERPDVNLTVS